MLCKIKLNFEIFAFSSCVSERSSLDACRYFPGALLRHLQATEVPTMANTVPRIQDDRARLGVFPRLEHPHTLRDQTQGHAGKRYMLQLDHLLPIYDLFNFFFRGQLHV